MCADKSFSCWQSPFSVSWSSSHWTHPFFQNTFIEKLIRTSHCVMCGTATANRKEITSVRILWILESLRVSFERASTLKKSGVHWNINSSLSPWPGVRCRVPPLIWSWPLWHQEDSGILVVLPGEARKRFYIQESRNLWVQKSRNRDHSACWGNGRDHHGQLRCWWKPGPGTAVTKSQGGEQRENCAGARIPLGEHIHEVPWSHQRSWRDFAGQRSAFCC